MERPGDGVTFDDVAVYFTEEEWWSLETWQKELYKEVMMDNIRNLSSIDSSAVRPEIILKILMGSVLYGEYVPTSRKEWRGSSGELPFARSLAGLRTCPVQNTAEKAKEVKNGDGPHITATSTLEILTDFALQLHGVKMEASSSGTVIMECQEPTACCKTMTCSDPAVGPELVVCGDLAVGPQPVVGSDPAVGPQPVVGSDPAVGPQPVVGTDPDLCSQPIKGIEPGLGSQLMECNEPPVSPCPQPEVASKLTLCPQMGECSEPDTPHEPLGCHEVVVDPPPAENRNPMENSKPDKCQAQPLCDEAEGHEKLEKGPEASPETVMANKACSDEADSGAKLYICANCGETFDVWKFLVRHFIVHGGMRPHKCPDCDKSFTYPSKLLTHQKTHLRPKSFSCPNCGKRFTHQSNLLIHQKTHCGQKPHVCQDCGKSFMYPSKLLTHQKTHSGNKPHRCADCGKSFVYRCMLLAHQESHNGQKPFQCSVCQKGFPRKSSLIIHMRRHTGERPYQCHICSRGFVEHAKLRRHIRVHTGEKPYQCPICAKCFNDSSTLNRHKRMHSSPGGESTQDDLDPDIQHLVISNTEMFHSSDSPNIEMFSSSDTQNFDLFHSLGSQNIEMFCSSHTTNIEMFHSLDSQNIEMFRSSDTQNSDVFRSSDPTAPKDPRSEINVSYLEVTRRIKSEPEEMMDIRLHQQPHNRHHLPNAELIRHLEPNNEQQLKHLQLWKHPEPDHEQQVTHPDHHQLENQLQLKSSALNRHIKTEKVEVLDNNQSVQSPKRPEPKNEQQVRCLDLHLNPEPQQKPQLKCSGLGPHNKSEKAEVFICDKHGRSQNLEPVNEQQEEHLQLWKHPEHDDEQRVTHSDLHQHAEPQNQPQLKSSALNPHIKTEKADVLVYNQSPKHPEPKNEQQVKCLDLCLNPEPPKKPQLKFVDLNSPIKTERAEELDFNQCVQSTKHPKPDHEQQVTHSDLHQHILVYNQSPKHPEPKNEQQVKCLDLHLNPEPQQKPQLKFSDLGPHKREKAEVFISDKRGQSRQPEPVNEQQLKHLQLWKHPEPDHEQWVTPPDLLKLSGLNPHIKTEKVEELLESKQLKFLDLNLIPEPQQKPQLTLSELDPHNKSEKAEVFVYDNCGRSQQPQPVIEQQVKYLDLHQHSQLESETHSDFPQHLEPRNQPQVKCSDLHPHIKTEALEILVYNKPVQPQHPSEPLNDRQVRHLDFHQPAELQDDRLKFSKIRPHIKTRNEALLIRDKNLKSQRDPKPPHEWLVKHSDQHPNPDTEHRLTPPNLNHIKSEDERSVCKNHIRSQHEHILKSPAGFQCIETKDELVIKYSESQGSGDTQPNEVLKWSVNNQEVENENPLVLQYPEAGPRAEPPSERVLKWTVNNQHVGFQDTHLAINEQVLKWTVDNQHVETLNEHVIKQGRAATQSEYKLKCMDCGLVCQSLSQFIKHRRIHRLDKKARLSTVMANPPLVVPIAEKAAGPSSMCRDLVLQNLDLITTKNPTSDTDGKLVVSVQAFPRVTDTIRTQVESEIQVIQLE